MSTDSLKTSATHRMTSHHKGSSKAGPPPPKENNTTESSDVWYEIKDIVAEKFEKGRLWYKIDWADDTATLQPYDQSWIPAEDANKEAVDNWNQEKHWRADSEPASQYSSLAGQSVQESNGRAERRAGHQRDPKRRHSASNGYSSLLQKRHSAASAAGSHLPSEDSGPSSSQVFLEVSPNRKENNRVVVELGTRPQFDPSEYTTFSSSQITSGVDSQAPSQPGNSVQILEATGVSQRTIPDSQDPSTLDYSQETDLIPGHILHAPIPETSPLASAGPAAETRSAHQSDRGDTLGREGSPSGQVIKNSVPSETSIPSHQPEGPQGLERLPENHTAVSGQHTASSHPSHSHLIDSHPVSKGDPQSSTPGFLTQPDFALNSLSSSVSVIPQTNYTEEIIGDSAVSESPKDNEDSQPRGGNSAEVPEHTFQNAQIIYQTQDHGFAEVGTQSQQSATSDDEEIIIAQTVWKKRPAQSLFQTDNRTLGGSDSTTDILVSETPIRRRGERERIVSSQPTAQRGKMDSSAPESQSAIDELRKLMPSSEHPPVDSEGPLHHVGVPETSRDLVSPSTALPNTAHDAISLLSRVPESEAMSRLGESMPGNEVPASAVDQLRLTLGLDHDFSKSNIRSTNLKMTTGHHSADLAAQTVTPSELMNTPLYPSSGLIDATVVTILPGGDSHGSTPHINQDSSLEGAIMPLAKSSNEYIVTLPLAANMRSQYLAAINDNKRAIESFSGVFAGDFSELPEESLVSQIDSMLRRLVDTCDMPAFVNSLPPMTDDEMKKHAIGTNGKYSFLYEFLRGIRNLDRQVVIVSRPGKQFEFLRAMIISEGYKFRLAGHSEPEQTISESALSLVLANTDQDYSALPPDPNIVVAFDRDSRTFGLAYRQRVAPTKYDEPMMLTLVITHSIEHIDLRISTNMDPLERKNALVIAICQARSLVAAPELGYIQPHDAAEQFAQFVREPTADFLWEPQDIPDDIFDVYLSTQQSGIQEAGVQSVERSTRSQSRKRQLDDADGANGTPKRARVTESDETGYDRSNTHISDALKMIFGEAISVHGQFAEVPIAKLEALSNRILKLETALKDKERVEEVAKGSLRSLETQLRSYEKTTRNIQPKYMEALRDRGTFEIERDNAVRSLEATAAKLEASNAMVEGLKEKNRALEQKVVLATAQIASGTHATPSSSIGATPLPLPSELQAKIALLEKKAANASEDMDFLRANYQTASRQAAQLGTENVELQARLARLEIKASDSVATVNRINGEAEMRELRRLWAEQAAISRDREYELDRAREEVRLLKNGRRETRQASVPRSPRLGVMSPRTGRGSGSGSGNPAREGGGGSRGGSPAPLGMFDGAGAIPGVAVFNQQLGNGRWGHLRD